MCNLCLEKGAVVLCKVGISNLFSKLSLSLECDRQEIDVANHIYVTSMTRLSQT